MKESIINAIGETIEDLLKNGLKTSFTDKELIKFGVTIPEIEIKAEDIKRLREKIKMSQSVFARLLNVNSSSVKQWEQGKRNPSGSTKVLLELLLRNPEILNYRFGKSSQAK
jgi:putative transcriptional regulator